MTSNRRKAEFYREQNLDTARIIAAGPHRYPGLMQEWARRPSARCTEPAIRSVA
jgi:hypothetical protein